MDFDSRYTIRTDIEHDFLEVIDFQKIIKDSTEKWQNRTLVRVNESVVRLGVIQGEFHWHKHANQDELFYILKGKLVIQLKDQPDITLSEGQMAVIPKGIEHCPKSIEPSYVLLFEPFILQSRGD